MHTHWRWKPWALGIGAAAALLATIGLRDPNQVQVSTTRVTAVGFALVNMSETVATVPPQLEIDFQETALTAQAAASLVQQAMAKVTTRLKTAGVQASAITPQGPPSLNNQDGSWQVSSSLQVNFSSLAQLEAVADKTEVTDNPVVQNIYINNRSSTMKATPAALAAGYARAVRHAEETATMIAAADHRKLGTAVSMEEGAGTVSCASLGCSAGATEINPPQPGANQEVIAVTVIYRTVP